MANSSRKTDFYLSLLAENLYGRQGYKKVKNHLNKTSATIYYLKLIKSIKFAIEETITITDTLHKKEFSRTLNVFETSIKEATSLDELDQRMIAFQSELVFLLIGGFPRRLSSEKIINSRNMWKLDFHRQIQYTQSIEQKKSIIFAAVQGKYNSRFGTWGSFLTKIYSKQCESNPEFLVTWIKANHPDIYLDLF